MVLIAYRLSIVGVEHRWESCPTFVWVVNLGKVVVNLKGGQQIPLETFFRWFNTHILLLLLGCVIFRQKNSGKNYIVPLYKDQAIQIIQIEFDDFYKLICWSGLSFIQIKGLNFLFLRLRAVGEDPNSFITTTKSNNINVIMLSGQVLVNAMFNQVIHRSKKWQKYS